MLTIEEIRDVKFRKSGICGYKADDVDIFIDEVEESFIKLEEEKENLQEKLKILADKVCEYRKMEESIKTALLNAQKNADILLNEARMESNAIVNQGHKKYQEIVEKAEHDIEDKKLLLETIKQNVRSFRNNILNMYKEHIRQVNLFTADERISTEALEKLNKKETNVTSLNEHGVFKSSNKDSRFGEVYGISEERQESPVGLFNQV